MASVPTPTRTWQDVLTGGGEMGTLIRAFDWSTAPAGPTQTWPKSLRTVLHIMLTAPFPMFLWWGPQRTQFNNDGYRPSLGANKHPSALGQRGDVCWAEIWHIIGPMVDAAYRQGLFIRGEVR